MATTDFGVTVAEVTSKLSISNPITAATTPSTSDVEGFVDDGDSQMAGALKSAGISADDIDDDTRRQVQEAIKNYAAAETLAAMNVTGRAYSNFKAKWDEVYSRYTSRPQLLRKRIDRIHSNVDTTPDATTAGFVGRDYKF